MNTLFGSTFSRNFVFVEYARSGLLPRYEVFQGQKEELKRGPNECAERTAAESFSCVSSLSLAASQYYMFCTEREQ